MSRRNKMMAFFKVYKYALYDIVTDHNFLLLNDMGF